MNKNIQFKGRNVYVHIQSGKISVKNIEMYEITVTFEYTIPISSFLSPSEHLYQIGKISPSV